MGFHVHFVFRLSMISYVFCVDPASIRPRPVPGAVILLLAVCRRTVPVLVPTCAGSPALVSMPFAVCSFSTADSPFQFGCTFDGCVCGAVSLSRSGPYGDCAPAASGIVGVEPFAPVPEDTWASGQAVPMPLAPYLVPPAFFFVIVVAESWPG